MPAGLGMTGLKKKLTITALVVATLAAVAWTWSRTTGEAPEQAEGLYVKCTKPDCGHFFVIPWDEQRTYPRGPSGEGFKCPKCGQFSGQIAAKCPTCGDWIASTESTGRGGGCPKCNPPEQPGG